MGEEMMDIRPGNVVTLKTDVVQMVVDAVNEQDKTCYCVWHSHDGVLQSAILNECSLKKKVNL